ncbi:MAG: hypothetical protein U0Q03_16435 [Acidimicrobiales bacterium]
MRDARSRCIISGMVHMAGQVLGWAAMALAGLELSIALRSLVARRRPGLRQGRRTEPRTSGGSQRRIGVVA